MADRLEHDRSRVVSISFGDGSPADKVRAPALRELAEESNQQNSDPDWYCCLGSIPCKLPNQERRPLQ